MPWNNNWNNKRSGGNWGGGGGGWVKKNFTKKKSFIIHKQTIWVGNLADNVKYADLLALANQVGSPVWAEVHKGNKGLIGYATEAEAKKAINALNGAQLDGVDLEVSAYTKVSKN